MMESNSDSNVNHSKMIQKNQPCIELRFLIPSKVAGSVIGKSGENIRNLRRSYMARINISDNSGPERVLSLEADIDTILDILRHSLDKIEGVVPLPRAGSGDIGEYSNQVDLRMLVNQSLVGALIGRGGGRINDLREKCDLRVLKVYQNVCPESTDRIVQMVGSISPIIDCIGKVVDMCKETPVREPKINYDAQNYDPTIATHYGGWFQNSPRSETFSLGFSRPGFTKQQQQQQGGQYTAEPYDYNYSDNYRELEIPFRSPQYDVDGDVDTSATNNNNNSSDFKQTIRLPHKIVGAIIGPGGTRIQQIRLDSEAHITISSPDRNPQERTVTISGSLSKVRRAQNMINECLDKYGK